jgi:outer membrane immunogenic protein
LFVKGGAAWERVGSTGLQLLANGAFSSTSDVPNYWRDGWVIGVGAEWGFAPNWSAKIEYDHLDFGSTDISVFSSSGRVTNVSSAAKVDIIKGGVNYHFNWGTPVVAKY